MNRDYLKLADIYQKIAEIYSEHYQEELMAEYYCRASSIYLKISE